jgi:C1A family cysteine protease
MAPLMKFAAIAGVAAAAQELRDYNDYDFQAYLAEHGKSYGAEELQFRKTIFEQNMQKVKEHNEAYKAGHHTWFMAVNHLADLTSKEFSKLRSAKYNPSTHPTTKLTATASAPNPASVDWRTKGVLSAVKNQGGCGSCWAFSATESVESAYAIASGKLLTLAPQTYVNCVKNPQSCGGTGGCEGATMELAFNMTAQKGIALESTLPYRGRDETCTAYTPAVTVSGYVKNPTNDAKGLETACAQKGPQSITVAAGSWQL